MKKAMVGGGAMVLMLITALAQQGMTQAQQKSMSDEGGRILALEKAWSRALEAKDTKALDMLLANTLVSVDIDGSVASSVQVYGNAAVVTGTFRVKGTESEKPCVRRERFTDTWIKINEAWQCVASQTTLIPSK